MSEMREMREFNHSVTLDKSKCKGCINCIKRCPTEAIRVRNGKAKIIPERCIDCAECIRICHNHAKQPIFDSVNLLTSDELKGKYKIAMPAPALYGQFRNIDDLDIILGGLLRIGFDDVFEVAKAAEIVSQSTRILMEKGDLKRPIISSACPSVTRLISVRFPELVDNVLPLLTPVGLAAKLARELAAEKKGIPAEDIVTIFISPCPAKVTAARNPIRNDESGIDYVFAIKEVYPKMLAVMSYEGNDLLLDSGKVGIGWASSGGESAGILHENYLAADGIENVIKVLEDIEDDKMDDIDFIELNACAPGCVGGVLNVENPYLANTRIKNLKKYLPVSCNHIGNELPKQIIPQKPLEFNPVMELSTDLSTAMSMLSEMKRIEDTLPGLDCGSCGAPSCHALAEDVVRGFGNIDDCIFRLRQHFRLLSDEIHKIETHIPSAFRSENL